MDCTPDHDSFAVNTPVFNLERGNLRDTNPCSQRYRDICLLTHENDLLLASQYLRNSVAHRKGGMQLMIQL